MTTADDQELSAMSTLRGALEPLSAEERERVLNWAADRFRVRLVKTGGAPGTYETPSDDGSLTHDTFADAFDAFQPKTDAEKFLIAAYWEGSVKGEASFGSAVLNKMLRDLGHGSDHTAQNMQWLIDQKPARILQLSKSGKSQQARKTYKITREGIRVVLARLGSGES